MTFTRKDFLRLSTILTASALVKPKAEFYPTRLSTDPNAKNILIIIFDALSAKNINFYGYPRETMPNLTRLLDRATVFHNHYASANFTTPGTASLLTGLYSWTHRALKISDTVKEELADRSIFSYFNDYYSFTYTHNVIAEILLLQFGEAINKHMSFKSLFLENDVIASSEWFDALMGGDIDTANLFKTRLADANIDGFLYSLIFPSLLGEVEYQAPPEIIDQFPRGIPISSTDGMYILEDAIEWTKQQAASLPQPFLGYVHFFPPHSPFNTRKDFVDSFANIPYDLPEKPLHPVIIPAKRFEQEEILENRRYYDEFVLYADSEFNRLFSNLEEQGVLDNTLVVLTSDHGDAFERKAIEHTNPFLFEPLVNIPLVIFKPGQTERQDVYDLTSCIDLLPTLLDYTGHEIPSDLPGQILPTFTDASTEDSRSIFALDARLMTGQKQLTPATLMMRKDNYKVIRYSGYADYYEKMGHPIKLELMQIKDEIYYEVFDLQADPEELTNLALDPTTEVQALIDELETYYQTNLEV